MPNGHPTGPENSASDTARMKRLGRAAQSLIQDNLFIRTVEEARTDPAARAQLKASPKAHLQSKGCRISHELEVEFTEDNSFLICVYYYYYFQYRVQYCYVYMGF